MGELNRLRISARSFLRSTAACLGLLAASGACIAQQPPPQLQIASPADGAIVNPGQTVSVNVTSPANVAFTQVGIVGPDPLGFSSIATSVPASFSLAIPTEIACGPLMLTAFAATSDGQSAQSATILIDVERPDLPTSLSALMPAIYFESQGEQSPVVVLGTFTDGSVLDVARSSNLSYVSSNTSIATVDSSGIVKAISTGATTVTATYTLGGKSVQMTISVRVPSPVLAAAPSSLTFVGQNTGTSSTPQQVTLTNSGSALLKVISLRTTGDFLETDNCVTSSPLAPGASCAASITFRPTAVGTRTGGLTVANGFNITPATFSLTGTGVGPQLVSVAVTPTNSSVMTGNAEQFTATGIFSDGTTSNLTNSATWTSSTSSVATIGTTGLASAVGPGTTTISATSARISGSTGLTVPPSFSALTSIAQNFNGTAIPSNSFIWFNSNFQVNGGLGSTPATLEFQNASIQFLANGAQYNLPVPNSLITLSPSANCASVTFSGSWQVTVPISGSDEISLSALAFPVPAGGLPGGIQNVTWRGTILTNQSGLNLQWKWGAAVYTSFSTNYSSLGVKPTHQNACAYNNGDHAGTPENFKASVTGGATGGGGSNWTGSWSGTASVQPH